MMLENVRNIRNIIFPVKANDIEEEEEENYAKGYEAMTNIAYQSVPLTLALRKRKYEEEQYSKYSIKKEKTCEII